MVYKIIVSPRAQQELEDTIDYYSFHSTKASDNFIKEVEKVYNILAENPYFAIKYKNIRSIKIKRYPYSIYFTVNKSKRTVKVLACFHHKRNPQQLPNK